MVDWMRLGALCLINFAWFSAADANEILKPSEAVAAQLAQHSPKEAIAVGLRSLAQVPAEDKAALMVQLAIAYAQDQELESAFSLFLEALNLAPKESPPPVSPEEARLYDEALAIYLEQQGPSALKAAQQIQQDFLPIIQSHPDYYLLGYLVAAAKANQSEFDQFFPLFFASYQHYPEHYLAYKTKALLNLKLWQRGKIPGEREAYRAQLRKNLQAALERYPKDSSIYRMTIAFSNDEEKAEVVAVCLNNIIQANIVIPREDIIFFTQEAVDAGQRTLAQHFVDNARSWYKHSRAVQRAQQLIDAQQ